MANDVSQDPNPKKLKQDQDAFAEGPIVSTSAATLGMTDDVPISPVNNSGPGSQISDDLDGYNSESSYYGDNLSYCDEDFSYDEANLQAQFDCVDLPAGVEVSLPWLAKPSSSQNPASTSSSIVPSQWSSHCNKERKETIEACLQKSAESQTNKAGTSDLTTRSPSSSCKGEEKVASTNNSTISSQSESRRKNEGETEVDLMEKFRLFKTFDTVEDYSDHHFTHGDSKTKQAPQKWTKTIQQEWKILEKDLPDTIFVRTYEERMDLLRAVIVGTPGTPYHDGLFFFDVFFPSDYPGVPPQVFYYSGGLRLNPNLYECGKVCLSLLNTWHGRDDEKWIPGKSTMLQVLLSIQALVLNEKPFFNEPGYESMAGQRDGEAQSLDYNENTFILSCKTMLYTLRRPPKYYEEFVVGHFRLRAHTILEACKAYIGGVSVGCLTDPTQDMDKEAKGASDTLKGEVSEILPRLVQAFTKNGAKDCELFLPTRLDLNALSA